MNTGTSISSTVAVGIAPLISWRDCMSAPVSCIPAIDARVWGVLETGTVCVTVSTIGGFTTVGSFATWFTCETEQLELGSCGYIVPVNGIRDIGFTIRDAVAEVVKFTEDLAEGNVAFRESVVGTDPGKKGILIRRVRGALCSVLLLLLLCVGTLISMILGLGCVFITIGIVVEFVDVNIGESLVGTI